MPIISRSLTKLSNREDHGRGVKRWRVDGVDSKGRRWMHGPFNGTQAEAEAIQAAVLPWDTKAADFADLLRWVQDRTDPETGAQQTVASFDYANRDIVEDEGEEFIFKWFAESFGVEANTVAWWMDRINTRKFNSIRDRIGYTGAKGSDITSRFTFLVAVEPWHDPVIKAP